MAKMIIFDYGRTLYDRETDDFFPDAIPVVRTLAEKYRLRGPNKTLCWRRAAAPATATALLARAWADAGRFVRAS